jgi:hypothetical protein
MKRYMSKRMLALLVIPTLLLSFAIMPDKSKFGGSWNLNESKSELGDFGARFSAKKIKVDQKDDAITIAKTMPGFNGGEDQVRTETLTFDGKATETTNTGGFGTSKRKATLKWSADEKSFVITQNTVFEGQNGPIEINGTETWTLGTDGKTLTAETHNSSPQGEYTVKAVYDKAE